MPNYDYKNIRISSKIDSTNYSWYIVENPAYKIILDGHLYLSSSPTIEIQHNLKLLLQEISLSTIEKGLKTIAGGLFNLIIIDKQQNRMIVSGDRYGIMPLFYTTDEDGFHVSGNQFTFSTKAPLSEAAVIEFLKYGYLPFSPSLFSGVERLLPGQSLHVSLESQKVSKTPAQVFEFKPPNHRITNLDEASQRIHLAFKKYLSRFSQQHIGLLVNENHSYQLLSAGFKNSKLQLIEFEGKSSREQKMVAKLSRKVGFAVAKAGIFDDFFSRFTSEVSQNFRIICSLEDSFPLTLFRNTAPDTPSIYLDGFMGDMLFGGGFLLEKLNLPALNPNFRREKNYNTPIQSIIFYQNILYDSPGAIPDHDLQGILTPEVECWFLNAARGVLEINRNAGHTHEDFVESLVNYTQLRSLSSARPVALSSLAFCATPFMDYEIVQRCLETARQLRVNDSLYNFYFKAHFPEFAKLFKIGSWGKVLPFGKRQIFNHSIRRFASKISSQSIKTFAGSTGGSYLQKQGFFYNQPESKPFIKDAIANPNSNIPPFITESINSLYKSGKLSEKLLLRYLSLNFYLKY